MNKVILIGRLTRDPDVKQAQSGAFVARYTLAVDRRYQKGEEKQADFPQCVAFGKSAEFARDYLRKGKKIVVTGRLQTGSYTKQDGTKVYTTDVIVEDQEFAESKAAERQNIPQAAQQAPQQSQTQGYGQQSAPYTYGDSIPAGFTDEEDGGELPF